jgi:GDP-4-dehydro-6-deoxy-D-mannose reductase
VPRRALITGGSGFVGQWLARALLEQSWTVVAASTSRADTLSGALSAAERDAVTWLQLDMRDAGDVARAIDESEPHAVFHLAGVSYIPDAQEAPETTYGVNVLGAVRLLAELGRRRRAGGLEPTVLVIGSGTQYGRHDPAELPLTESAEQRPVDVYAASKAAQEIASLQVHRAEGLRVICTRSFNHSGPGHPAHFLLPGLVRRALALPARPDATLQVGNQESVRDYLHVADVVHAYMLLMERGTPGEVYNVCSGDGVSVRALATEVLLRVGRTAEITTDSALARSVDVPALVGSAAKLQRATGWLPTRTRADIIDDLIHAATH